MGGGLCLIRKSLVREKPMFKRSGEEGKLMEKEGNRKIIKIGREYAEWKNESFETQDLAILSNVFKWLSNVKLNTAPPVWIFGRCWQPQGNLFQLSSKGSSHIIEPWKKNEIKKYGLKMQPFSFMNTVKGQRKTGWMLSREQVCYQTKYFLRSQ